ncbi:hypothetical protein NA57DRAFT_58836 [Rhizodiscina lignyota]|uniref:Uncharacterized protein n=1 Tax=Rhizodiscina lignyota TaxID=1504668 RepID=A0A9P4M3Q3_9PEZI|nr:hypothetical protein NA57DRAFT_58836 [Rhizodiscina lignyota]
MAPNRSISPQDVPMVHPTASPPRQISKIEKKRSQITDKLSLMIKEFNQNLRPHYEAQLNAIQVDINLITRADPYQTTPLPDSPEEVQKVIHELFGGQIPADPVAAEDFTAQAGKLYEEFAIKVNDLMEQRDVALAMLATVYFQQNKHDKSLDEVERRHKFHVQLAQEEHKLLADTVRQRLFATLEKKRRTLLAEKEALDIGDSNASLLHPDQYRHMHNPSSPGGTQNARKTRNARHRVDLDELPSAAVAQENRRKRKAEDADESPGPGTKHHGPGSPYRDAKAKQTFAQYGASALSIERLFTEKELALNMNTAALAATNFMVQLRDAPKNSEATNGMNGYQTDTEDAPGASTSIPTIMNEATDPEDDATPAAAPEMDRTANTSQYAHQTRGATRNALADLATIAGGQLPFPAHSIPTYVPAIMGAKANGAAPTPQSLTGSEIDQDFAIFGRRDVTGDDTLNTRLLEHAVGEEVRGAQNFAVFRLQPPAPAAESEKDEPAGLGLLPHGLRTVPMSRQTSTGGMSDVGGAPMSRTGSAMGGTSMRRMASNRGRGRGRVDA